MTIEYAQLEAKLEAQSKVQPTRSRRYLRVTSPARPDSDDLTFSFDRITGGAKDFVTGQGYNARQIARLLGVDDSDWQPIGYLETRQERAARLKRESESDAQRQLDFETRAAKVMAAAKAPPQAVCQMLETRGIDGASLLWHGKRGLLLPYYRDGKLVSVRTRKDDRKHKYMGIKGGRVSYLFNGDSIAPDKPVIIFESELDALAFEARGYDMVAVATGGTSGGHKDIERVQSARCAYIAFDNDGPGIKASKWWEERGCIQHRPRGAKDFGDMVMAGLDVDAWVAAAPKPIPALAWSRDEIAQLMYSLRQSEAVTTALLPDLDLPEQFTAADAYKRMVARNIKLSERSIRRAFDDCILLEPADGKRWRFVDKATVNMRLAMRVQNRQQHDRYERGVHLELYADKLDDAGYDIVADTYDDRPPAKAWVPEWTVDDMADKMTLPDRFDDGGFLAWWRLQNHSEGETIARPDLMQRTGLSVYQQKVSESKAGIESIANKKTVAAQTANDARKHSGIKLSYAVCIGYEMWRVIGANTYRIPIRTGFDKRQETLSKKLSESIPVDDDTPATERKKPPILPKIDRYDCDITSEPYLARALFYFWQDKGLLDVDDWRGKEVTLAGLVEYQRQRQQAASPTEEYDNRREAIASQVPDIPF